MSVERGQDQCGACGMLLPNEDPRPDGTQRTPCPRCGSIKRIKFGDAQIGVSVNVQADAKLVIGWQEVDRLLAEREFAAALLVAAVNVEFILWETLRRFTPSAALASAPEKVKSVWGQIRTNHPRGVTLSSLISVVEHLTQYDKLAFSPSWDPLVRHIDAVRNRIAHERGYFALLTQLRDQDWPETRIRQVLEEAKEFCHGNAP
ncbi:MAG: hypothetical protein NT125_08510 [Candidatus Bipolaricaulota bacterium]|nr:hypothetical protein [Candidatus Bipolaricaulota bacterium]